MRDVVFTFIGLTLIGLTAFVLLTIAFWPLFLGGWWLLALLFTIPLACSIGLPVIIYAQEQWDKA